MQSRVSSSAWEEPSFGSILDDVQEEESKPQALEDPLFQPPPQIVLQSEKQPPQDEPYERIKVCRSHGSYCFCSLEICEEKVRFLEAEVV